MATEPTANELKTALVQLFTVPLGTTKKAKILDYLPEAFIVPDYEDITALRSPLDPVTLASGKIEKRVNCLLITELGFSQSPPQSDSTNQQSRPRGKNLITRRFGLYYPYQFGQGSEAIFSANVEVVRTTLNDNPKLGLATVAADGTAGKGAYVDHHNALQVRNMLPASFGGNVICHLMEASLEIIVEEAL